jgi:hypothetical protein
MTVMLIATPTLCSTCFWRRNETAPRMACSIDTSNDGPVTTAEGRISGGRQRYACPLIQSRSAFWAEVEFAQCD